MRPLRQDLDLYNGPRQPDGSPTWTLHDPVRNRFFTIGLMEFEFLRRWGMGSFKDLAQRINQETTLRVSPRHGESLQQFLQQNELLLADDPESVQRFTSMREAEAAGWKRRLLHNYLFFRVPLIKPDRFLGRTLPYIRFIYSRKFALAMVLITLLGLTLVARQWDSFIHTFSYAFTLEGVILFGVTLFVTKIFHELGHAYTAKYYGVRVPTMGIAFLVMWPVLYTDTSESWKLASRRSRLAIGAAGMIAEVGLAGIATLLWNFLPDGAVRSAVFFIAAISWVFTLGINFNPFMRWDGYYLLSDLIGVQNLQERAFAYARWVLREWLFGFGDPPPERFPEEKRRWLLVYAYSTWIYRFVLFMGIAVLVYHLFFKLAGLAMAGIELYYFIFKPIQKEVGIWYRRRGQIRWNRRTVRTAALFGLLFGLLLVPWTSHIHAPGLQRSFAYTEIYPPIPAQIRLVNVENGDQVRQGDTLFELASPELERRLENVGRRIRTLQMQLAQQSARVDILERHKVIEQQLAEALAEQHGLNAQADQLTLRAPFDGEIRDMPDGLIPGRWVGDRQPLGRVVNRDRNTLVAYLTEDELIRVQRDATGRFYPDEPSLRPIDVRIREIDYTNTHEFPDPYNASLYGGPVAVSQDPDDPRQLVSHEAIYRVHLEASGDIDSPEQVTRGTVRLDAESESILTRIWRMIGAVVVRESGF